MFDQAGALDKLEGFASLHGPDFYRMPRNTDSITLEKSDWQVPASIIAGDDVIVPLRAEGTVSWRLNDTVAAV